MNGSPDSFRLCSFKLSAHELPTGEGEGEGKPGSVRVDCRRRNWLPHTLALSRRERDRLAVYRIINVRAMPSVTMAWMFEPTFTSAFAPRCCFRSFAPGAKTIWAVPSGYFALKPVP